MRDLSQIANLQSIRQFVESEGFEARWGEQGLVVLEQRRMVHWIGDNEQWVIYGVSYKEMEQLASFAQWGMSLVLGGDAFWSIRDAEVAQETASILNLDIVEKQIL